MSQASNADRKNYIYNIIIIVMSAIFVVVCLTIGFLFWQRSKADANIGSSASGGNIQTEESAAAGSENTESSASGENNQGEASAQATPAPGQIAIPSYSAITVKADATSVEVPFRNPDVNGVYFVLTLTLDDGTELYKSNYIAPGESVGTATFTKALPKGTYTGKLKYETFSMDDYSQRNGTELPITVTAE